MTSPDGAIPGGAVNYGSLSEFASKTEADWNTEMNATATRPWGDDGVLGSLFQDLGRGQPLVISILESLARSLGLGGVWNTVEGVAGAIGGFINDIGASLSELWQFVLDLPIIGDIVAFVADIIDAVVDELVLLFTKPGEAIERLWDAFSSFIGNFWDWIVSQFVLLFTNPGQAVAALWDALNGFMGGFWDYIVDEFADLFRDPLGTIGKLGDAIRDFLLNLPILGDILGFLGDVLDLDFSSAGAFIQSVVSKLVGFFTSSAQWAGDFVTSIWKGIVAAFKSILNIDLGDIGKFLLSVVDAILGAFDNVAEWAGQFLNGAWTFVKKLFQQLISIDLSSIGAFVSSITAELGKVFATIASVATKVADEIFRWFKALAEKLGLDRVLESVGDAVDWVGDHIFGLGSKIVATISGLASWFVGTPFVQGVVKSISDLVESAARLFSRVDGTALTAQQVAAKLALPSVSGSWAAVDQRDDYSYAVSLIDGSSEPTGGKATLIPVTVTSNRPVNTITLSTASVGSGALGFAALYLVNRQTGAASLHMDCGDITAQLATTRNLQRIRLPKTITLDEGTLVYIAFTQNRSGIGLHRWNRPTTSSGVIPKALGLSASAVTHTVVDGVDRVEFAQSFTDAAVTPTTTAFWGGLGYDDGDPKPAPKAYSDTFNRKASNLGGAWLQRRGAIKTDDWKRGDFLGIGGTQYTTACSNSSAAYNVATYIGRLATPDHMVSAVPYYNVDASGAYSEMTLWARGNGKGASVFAKVYWNNTNKSYSVGIFTTDNYGDTTQQHRWITGITDFYPFTPFYLLCRGRKYEVRHVKANGELGIATSGGVACEWEDIGDTFKYTTDNTEAGLGLGASSASAADNWEAIDA